MPFCWFCHEVAHLGWKNCWFYGLKLRFMAPLMHGHKMKFPTIKLMNYLPKWQFWRQLLPYPLTQLVSQSVRKIYKWATSWQNQHAAAQMCMLYWKRFLSLFQSSTHYGAFLDKLIQDIIIDCKYLLNKPRHEKTCLWGLRSGKTQTGLLNYRS